VVDDDYDDEFVVVVVVVSLHSLNIPAYFLVII